MLVEVKIDLVTIDELDRKIISTLQMDGRISFSRLAKSLKVSESTIYLRIKKLRDNGILRGFTVDIDHRKLGKDTIAYVFVKTAPRQHQRATKIIQNIEEIYEIYEITGEYQLLLKIITESRRKLSEIVRRIRRVDGVREIYVTLVLETYKEEKTIRI